MFPSINEHDTVLFDTETNGLDWQTCHVVGYVVGIVRDGQIVSNDYFSIRHEARNKYSARSVVEWIKSWCRKPITLVGHNLKFDLHMSANDGIIFENATFFDTQVTGTLVDEHTQGGYSLDNLGKRYLPKEQHKLTDIYEYMGDMFPELKGKKVMGNFYKLYGDDERAIGYAAGDNITTWHLSRVLQELIEEQGLEVVHATEMRCIHALFHMERRGVPLDTEALDKAEGYIQRQAEVARATLPATLNINSAKQISDLYDEHGLDYSRTDKGNPSFTEKALKQTPVGRNILRVRKLTKMQSTFIDGAMRGKVWNGKIHCTFNQMFDGEAGTHTGRLSCSEPNMQQVPKRDKELAPLLRRAFRAPDGMLWSANDYSQQEYRIFAAYTGSEKILEAYRQGGDIHKIVADMCGVDRDPTGKMLNLAMLYWMGPNKMQEVLGIPLEVAQGYRDKYYEMFPEVPKFLRRCQDVARTRRYVKTILGRRQRFPEYGTEYTAANRVVQGSAADLVKMKLAEVNEFLMRESRGECGVVLQVHDELDWFVWDDARGRELDAEARRIMQDFSPLPAIADKVEMISDNSTGKNWGEASFPKVDWSIHEKQD